MTNEWNTGALDMPRFAESGSAGHWQTPLSGLPRVQAACEPDAASAPTPICDWSLLGQTRGNGARLQHWLQLQASLTLTQRCQRCLEPMAVPLAVDRWFRFVADEATALAEDDTCEEDLLAMSSEFDALNLLEDELLLAMPLIVSHGDCQPPPSAALGDDLPHPFAALAGLKLPKP
jgi:uncharacterized protein